MVTKESLAAKLGRRLRDLRLAKGYSQEGFADVAKLDRAGYGRVERGEVDLRLSSLERLAKALRVPIADLFAGIDGGKAKTAKESRSKREPTDGSTEVVNE
jgi:transcriptional regulator with XRE-family HTH domain